MNTTVDERGRTELHYESTSRAILRCKGKMCKRKGSREFTIFTTTREFNGRPSSVQTVSIDGGPKRSLRDRYELLRFLYTECPNSTERTRGSHLVTVSLVKGVYVENKTCDARCMNAVGPSCSCSCGGENHGGGLGSW